LAAKTPRLPDDAPYCATPGAAQTFVSPMGEPFRAAAGQPYPSALWLAAADRNHDGAIDRAEFLADAHRFFLQLDVDHDGRLTPEEVTAYEQDIAPEIALYRARPMLAPRGEQERGRADNRPTPMPDLIGIVPGPRKLRTDDGDYNGPMGAGRFTWLNIPQPVSAADADINRLVSAAEFAAAADRRFATIGAGLGPLKLAELAKTPAQMSLEGPCVPRPKPRIDNQRRAGEDPRAYGGTP
jgi:hypothetical protein